MPTAVTPLEALYAPAMMATQEMESIPAEVSGYYRLKHITAGMFDRKSSNIIFFHLDVNECVLGTDMCNENATCENTIGSYNCSCNDGFAGDGFNCTGEMLQTLTIQA